ncbi:hypothetical protein BDN72DRAFT_864606 [Pluteus cervinus]|uniref:Uncharacterized protein n=1 Tax=Pluteus cervinus TaxID=181527 RepID=A0ACD3A5M5_9AGAR|nr:hypothetical protein BDN72DRAFT_864606 [Pluteus cervinus]
MTRAVVRLGEVQCDASHVRWSAREHRRGLRYAGNEKSGPLTRVNGSQPTETRIVTGEDRDVGGHDSAPRRQDGGGCQDFVTADRGGHNILIALVEVLSGHCLWSSLRENKRNDKKKLTGNTSGPEWTMFDSKEKRTAQADRPSHSRGIWERSWKEEETEDEAEERKDLRRKGKKNGK